MGEDLHVSRSLRRTMNSGRLRVEIDNQFTQVLAGCADRRSGTWLTDEMMSAYTLLHRMGHAHSFEVYEGANLVGGLYGVQVGGLFAAESMFHRVTDASKVALVCAVTSLFSAGFALFDVQFLTPHLASLGTTVIPRCEYLARLRRVKQYPIEWATVEQQLRAQFPALAADG
jgi:leucyl/phenylalanyl-tRNA--protein transferase